ncbi:MAG: PHB depolymerase family esterase, partial [Gemmatimonadaceae bacterium]|nr:PHB depolymerase family esterase [Gemmatimonadaceae bacterium]
MSATGANAQSASELPLPGRHGRFVHDGVERAYLVVAPTTAVPPAARTLLLMLHGCTQDATDAARGTRLHEAAAGQGMTVVYAEQPAARQPQKCWTWYSAAETTRGAGEVAFLAALALKVATDEGIPATQIGVAGISAGGAMAANLLYAYPDVFRAAAVHSGVAAFAARDLPSGLAAMRAGPLDIDAISGAAHSAAPAELMTQVAIMGVHGAVDAVVAPVNLDALLAQAAQVARARGIPATTERVLVDGLGHAWSGGSSSGTFTDAAR